MHDHSFSIGINLAEIFVDVPRTVLGEQGYKVIRLDDIAGITESYLNGIKNAPTTKPHIQLYLKSTLAVMTVISNDPSWWPTINAYLISSYFIVAACVVVMYDWGLTFGQEVELVWRQRWSMMTVLYLIVQAIGFPLIARLSQSGLICSIPTIVITDAGCLIIDDALNWMSDVVEIILGIIIIVRLHAMYQQSRKVFDISRCHLSGHQNRQRGDGSNNNDAHLSG
ncbi:uncharacterized protein EDB93DRAFT_1108284, partial [Suillus bovinus]|uniref:uncharacterized protein n=1 Tax=Suillus bovinus TaxID=48563 RepID=UPI001B872621